jgi:hypothetical protein
MHPTDDLAHRAGLMVAHAAAQTIGSGAGGRNKTTPRSDERVSGSFFVPFHKATLPPCFATPISEGASGVVGTVTSVEMVDGVLMARIRMGGDASPDPLAGFTILPIAAPVSSLVRIRSAIRRLPDGSFERTSYPDPAQSHEHLHEDDGA